MVVLVPTLGFCVGKLVAVAPAILLQVVPSVDDCHWIVPFCPLTEALIDPPLQIVEAVVNVTVPATEVEFTVIVIGLEVAGAHGLLVTLTL